MRTLILAALALFAVSVDGATLNFIYGTNVVITTTNVGGTNIDMRISAVPGDAANLNPTLNSLVVTNHAQVGSFQTTGASTNLGGMYITPISSESRALVIAGKTGQDTDLIYVTNSAGTVYFRLDESGNAYFSGWQVIDNTMTVGPMVASSAQLTSVSIPSTNVAASAGTNITLTTSYSDWTVGCSNVNIAAIMGGTLGYPVPISILLTNGTGVTWGLSFSAVTNRWKWSYAQSAAAPSVLTNATQLLINARVDGTNVLASYAYFSWP